MSIFRFRNFILLSVFLIANLLIFPTAFSISSDSARFQPVDTQAEMIHQVAPKYPNMAKNTGLTGRVWIKVLVGRDGKVHESLVRKSSGTQALDDAALAVAKKNKFKPATQNGLPVPMWVTYKIDFEIRGRNNAKPRNEVDDWINMKPIHDELTSLINKIENIHINDEYEKILLNPLHPFSPNIEELVGKSFDSAIVLFVVVVGKNGKVNKLELVGSSHDGNGLIEAAEISVRDAEFSIKKKRRKKSSYSGYVIVQFQEDGRQDHISVRDANSGKNLILDTTQSGQLIDLPDPDDFQEVDIVPEMIYSVSPEYPNYPNLKSYEIGRVWIKVLVGRDGNVLESIVHQTSGSKILDAAALAVAKDNKFKPAMKDNKPVPMWVAYGVYFGL